MNKTEILKIMDLLEKNKQAELNEYLREQLTIANMKASGGNAEVKRYITISTDYQHQMAVILI